MMIDRSIDPTADQVRQLRDDGPDGPVTMVNLLKFKDRAVYPEDSGEPARSGSEAYALYEKAFSVTVGTVSQANIIYNGDVGLVFIGEPGTAPTDWDRVLIVRYPSRGHFLAMMRDETYRAALVHRYAAIERTVLLQCGTEMAAL
jgi:uncharacterized protein (DUF1330 family)